MHCKRLLDCSIISILVSGAISLWLSLDSKVSLFGCYKRFDGFLSTVVYVVLFCFVVQAVRKRDLEYFFRVIILTGMISCCYGVLQWVGLDIYKWNDVCLWSRPLGTLGNPVIFGIYLVMIMPFLYYYNMRKHIWSYPCTVFVLFTLMLTQTRGAFIGLFVSAVWFALLSGIKKRWICGTLGIVLLLSIIAPQSPVERFFDRGGSTRYHYQMIFVGMDIIKDYPVFGIGQDCLAKAYKDYYNKRYIINNHVWAYLYKYVGLLHDYRYSKVENQNRLHNEILDVAIDTGLVGLGCWLFFLICYFRMAWQKRKDALMVAVSSGVVAYLVSNLFAFGHIPTLTMFWVMVGFTVVIDNEEKR